MKTFVGLYTLDLCPCLVKNTPLTAEEHKMLYNNFNGPYDIFLTYLLLEATDQGSTFSWRFDDLLEKFPSKEDINILKEKILTIDSLGLIKGIDKGQWKYLKRCPLSPYEQLRNKNYIEMDAPYEDFQRMLFCSESFQ